MTKLICYEWVGVLYDVPQPEEQEFRNQVASLTNELQQWDGIDNELCCNLTDKFMERWAHCETDVDNLPENNEIEFI